MWGGGESYLYTRDTDTYTVDTRSRHVWSQNEYDLTTITCCDLMFDKKKSWLNDLYRTHGTLFGWNKPLPNFQCTSHYDKLFCFVKPCKPLWQTRGYSQIDDICRCYFHEEENQKCMNFTFVGRQLLTDRCTIFHRTWLHS